MLFKKFSNAAFLFSFVLSFTIYANGSKRPVSDFEGEFVLFAGSFVTDSQRVSSECPAFVRNTAFMGENSRGRVSEAWMEIASAYGPFMQFQNVNLGEIHLGNGRFSKAYTNSDSIITELGQLWYEERGRRRNPKLRTAVDFSYGVTFYQDRSFKVWSSSSSASCIYVLPHSR